MTLGSILIFQGGIFHSIYRALKTKKVTPLKTNMTLENPHVQ